jgi:hypothetical protein
LLPLRRTGADSDRDTLLSRGNYRGSGCAARSRNEPGRTGDLQLPQGLKEAGHVGVVSDYPAILTPESVGGFHGPGQFTTEIHRASGKLLVRHGDVAAARASNRPHDGREMIGVALDWDVHRGKSEGSERGVLHGR